MNNKKRKLLIVAAMILLLVAIIAMSVSTFAKYVTTKEASTTATVAKWGYEITADAADLFGANYIADGNTASTKLVVKTDATSGLAIDATSNAVAPGASGSMTIGITGTAEVAAAFAYTGTYEPVKLTGGSTDYTPIIWSLSDGSNTWTGANPITLLRTHATEMATYTLSWSWPFEGNNTNNTNDTILGKAAAAGNATVEYNEVTYTCTTTLTLALNINVEQVQPEYNNVQ